MEQFDPHNPEYKSTNDLPDEKKKVYVDLEDGGFVETTAFEFEKEAGEKAQKHNENRSLIEKLTVRNKQSPMDVLHDEALQENQAREYWTFPFLSDYRELFGKWPTERTPTYRDEQGVSQQKEQPNWTYEYKKTMKYFRKGYKDHPGDRDVEILYAIALLELYPPKNETDTQVLMKKYDLTSDEYWSYVKKCNDIRKSIWKN